MDSNKVLKIALMAVSLGGLISIFYIFNPSQHSFFFPCPFKLITGYHCPGCGSQRAIHQLLHGDIVSAFQFNPLMVLTLPILIYGLGITAWNFINSTQYRVKLFYNSFFIYGYFGLVAIYWVFRNIPYSPFNWLAPAV